LPGVFINLFHLVPSDTVRLDFDLFFVFAALLELEFESAVSFIELMIINQKTLRLH
jgi:hypothetical protein